MRQTLFSGVVVILLALVPAQVVIKEQPKDGVEVMNRDPNRGNEVRRHVILLQGHFADLPLCLPEQNCSLYRRLETQHNDIQMDDTQHKNTQHNYTQRNVTQHNDTQRNDTQHNDTQHNDTQRNDTQHNDTQLNDTQHNDTQHKNTQHN
jgi:hypothetical protein